MLQWMGGSRRKMATSRKSTHKRQKQYFEQRKRQQRTAGLESYSDGKRSCNLQCEYSRSLDILSLENLSTIAREKKTSCVTETDHVEHEDFTLNSVDAIPSQVIHTKDGVSEDHSEINDEWTPSSYVTEAECLEKVSVHLPNGNENLVDTFNNLDSFKLSMSHQISVIDLLGDGGANTNEEENSLHKQEAHVAFSVEGLGQVEAETPVHSPKISGSDRSFLNYCSPPKKARRVPVTPRQLDFGFQDLGSGLDVMMQSIDFSPRGSTLDQHFCARNVMDFSDDPNQKFTNFRRPSPYNWKCSGMQGVSGDDGLLYYDLDSSRNIWNEAQEELSVQRFRQAPSFLEDNIDDLGDCRSFCRNIDQRDIDFDDCFQPKNLWNQDLNFQGWDLNKKRSSVKRPETYNVKVSPGPYPKRSTVEDLHGIRISDMGWGSTVQIKNDVKDVDNSEAGENLSLLSEESCSSAAVRGDAAKKS